MGAQFSLVNWCGFLPQAPESTPGSCYLSPDLAMDVSFLPPLSRRRLSRLSKLSLRLAHETAPGYVGYCVFGSQHGELVTTQGLLEDLIRGEMMSPAGFSASVHNTAVGLHSIHQNNPYPCTSIAAGLDTVPACFMEAIALLAAGAKDVLIVYADDSVPSPLDEFCTDNNQPKGLAALIAGPQSTQPGYRLSQIAKTAADIEDDPLAGLMGMFSCGSASEGFSAAGEMTNWNWACHA